MAEGEEFRIPTVTAEEIDLTTVRAVVIIPDLEVSSKVFGAPKPKKNATVVPKFENNSFEVTAVVKKKEKENKFRYTVKKLPGDIVPEKCKTEYKKEQVILLLHKAEESSWAVQLSKEDLNKQKIENSVSDLFLFSEKRRNSDHLSFIMTR